MTIKKDALKGPKNLSEITTKKEAKQREKNKGTKKVLKNYSKRTKNPQKRQKLHQERCKKRR